MLEQVGLCRVFDDKYGYVHLDIEVMMKRMATAVMVFEKRNKKLQAIFFGLWIVLVAAIHLWLVVGAETAAEPPVNVLLIMVDTLRADHVGTYGHERDTTPHVDRFAEKATVFETTYSHSPWTMPSVASIFTSLPPRDHGVANWRQPLPTKFTTLAEHFQEHGFHTEAYVSHVIFDPEYNFNQGFEVYDYSVLDIGFPAEISTARELTDLFLQSLEEGVEEPFFAWLHYFDPHNEYLLHEEFNFGRRSIERYDSEIRYTDEQIGRVFEALTERELWDDTIVVFIADHGEEFLEHGNTRHTIQLYDEVIRIPMIVYVPGYQPRRISSIVRESDLAPTLCELVRLPISEQFVGLSLPRGRCRFIEPRDRPVYAETLNRADKLGVRIGQWKYIWDRENEERMLFDMDNDPREHRNLVEVRPREALRMRRALNEFYNLEREEAEEQDLSETRRQQLESLGYL